MNAPELSACCLHLLCTDGEGSFVFNGHRYRIVKNDLVVIVGPGITRQIVSGVPIWMNPPGWESGREANRSPCST